MVETFFNSENLSYKEAKYLFLPIPYEKSTSFLKGTSKAPENIIKNSFSLELFDPYSKKEYKDEDFFTLDPIKFEKNLNTEDSLLLIQKKVKDILSENKHLIYLGGEHTITLPIVKAYKELFKNKFSLLYFDAHYDMRDLYEGNRFSHACVMRRVYEEGIRIIGIGIRVGSIEDYNFSQKKGIKIFKSGEFDRDSFLKGLNELEDLIYISVDYDYFDPSILPAVGTPEIDGGTIYEFRKILKILKESGKRVIGIDFVEFLPVKNMPQYSYIASSIIFEAIRILFD